MTLRTELIAALPKGAVGVEVGVWEGDFSQQALDGCEPKKLYLVDPWEKNKDATNRTSTVTKTQAEIDCVHKGVVGRFSDDDRVTVIRKRSKDAAAELNKDGVLCDWVYIDAIHTYPAVCEDLLRWYQIVKAGGVIAGHDLDKPEVRLAVLEFANHHGLFVANIAWNFLMTKRVTSGDI